MKKYIASILIFIGGVSLLSANCHSCPEPKCPAKECDPCDPCCKSTAEKVMRVINPFMWFASDPCCKPKCEEKCVPIDPCDRCKPTHDEHHFMQDKDLMDRNSF